MTIPLIIIGITIIVGFVILRLYLSNQAKKLSEEIPICPDIKDELEEKFHDKQITNTYKENFLEPYENNYFHAERLMLCKAPECAKEMDSKGRELVNCFT